MKKTRGQKCYSPIKYWILSRTGIGFSDTLSVVFWAGHSIGFLETVINGFWAGPSIGFWAGHSKYWILSRTQHWILSRTQWVLDFEQDTVLDFEQDTECVGFYSMQDIGEKSRKCRYMPGPGVVSIFAGLFFPAPPLTHSLTVYHSRNIASRAHLLHGFNNQLHDAPRTRLKSNEHGRKHFWTLKTLFLSPPPSASHPPFSLLSFSSLSPSLYPLLSRILNG